MGNQRVAAGPAAHARSQCAIVCRADLCPAGVDDLVVGWCRAARNRGEAHRHCRALAVGLTISKIVRHHPTWCCGSKNWRMAAGQTATFRLI